MTFGKFKGRHLEDIDTDYLSWCVNNCQRMNVWLRNAIIRELASRSFGTAPIIDEDPSSIKEKLTTWFREMSLKFHPDRGGNHQAMVAINFANDRLKQIFDIQ